MKIKFSNGGSNNLLWINFNILGECLRDKRLSLNYFIYDGSYYFGYEPVCPLYSQSFKVKFLDYNLISRPDRLYVNILEHSEEFFGISKGQAIRVQIKTR